MIPKTKAQVIETAKRIVPFGRQDKDHPPNDSVYDEKGNFENGVSVAKAWSNKDEIIISFRGTVDIALDWLRNGQTLQWPFHGGMVHAGFLEEWKAVEKELIAWVRSHWRQGKKLYITGYSQGTAIALICTRSIQTKYEKENWKPVETYAFAGPRAGDWLFARRVTRETPVYRFEYGNDIVPHVPAGLSGPGKRATKPSAISLPENVHRSLSLSAPLPTLWDLITLIPLGVGYCYAGLLYYIEQDLTLHSELTHAQENDLAVKRLNKLLRDGIRSDIREEHLALPDALARMPIPL